MISVIRLHKRTIDQQPTVLTPPSPHPNILITVNETDASHYNEWPRTNDRLQPPRQYH
jgi:hypothetical protein